MTPISRTVFGKEVHFRLSNGRIAYVPLEELLDMAKSSLHKELPELNSPAAITEHEQTAGPFLGFEMRYSLEIEPAGAGRASFDYVKRSLSRPPASRANRLPTPCGRRPISAVIWPSTIPRKRRRRSGSTPKASPISARSKTNSIASATRRPLARCRPGRTSPVHPTTAPARRRSERDTLVSRRQLARFSLPGDHIVTPIVPIPFEGKRAGRLIRDLPA